MKKTICCVAVCLIVSSAAAQTMTVDSMDDASGWKSNHTDNRITISGDPKPKEGKGAVRFDSQVEALFAICCRLFKPDEA